MAEAAQTNTNGMAARVTAARWMARLTWCFPGVFILGAGTLALTFVLYVLYNPPTRLAESIPTISETASMPPGSWVFHGASTILAGLILICWPLNFLMNRHRFQALAIPGKTIWPLEAMNFIACALGMAAGIFLGLLGVYRLHDGDANHEMHLWLSIFFYSSQVSAFLFDGVCAIWQRSVLSGLDGPNERLAYRSRRVIAGTTVVLALWFLYMYLDRAGPWDLYIGQLVYVLTEYTLALFCFAYPFAPFPEVRHHYTQRLEAVARAAML